MRLDRKENVEVARRPAADPGFPLAGKPDAGAVFDPGGNIDGEIAFTADAAGAVASLAGIVDRFAPALAGWAGALDGEEALLGPYAALTATGRAGLRLRSGFRAGPGTGLARDRGRHLQARRLAGKCLFQRDLHVVAE